MIKIKSFFFNQLRFLFIAVISLISHTIKKLCEEAARKESLIFKSSGIYLLREMFILLHFVLGGKDYSPLTK